MVWNKTHSLYKKKKSNSRFKCGVKPIYVQIILLKGKLRHGDVYYKAFIANIFQFYHFILMSQKKLSIDEYCKVVFTS